MTSLFGSSPSSVLSPIALQAGKDSTLGLEELLEQLPTVIQQRKEEWGQYGSGKGDPVYDLLS
jgi:hypothetical protein